MPGTIDDAQQRLQVSRFFFWTAWVASTLRPGEDYSYTNNWPPDARVGNVPSTDAFFYSIAGVLSLLAHYTIHPASFFIPVVAKLIPYSWAKTWHLQLMIFWIATTWIASAIYLAPIIGGKEPAKQGLLELRSSPCLWWQWGWRQPGRP